jgi:type VI protein secretion system component VasA
MPVCKAERGVVEAVVNVVSDEFFDLVGSVRLFALLSSFFGGHTRVNRFIELEG